MEITMVYPPISIFFVSTGLVEGGTKHISKDYDEIFAVGY
jgi:hypothetical protein